MIRTLLPIFLFCLWPAAGIHAQATTPARPFPQHVNYCAGTILPDHVDQDQLDQDVRWMYDAWKSRYLIPAGQEADGQPRFRIEHGGGNTVSEGQGYGMLLAVYLAGYDPRAREIFDGLWEFALDHPSIYDSRLMDWYVNGDETPDSVGDDSAFDGDCDMAFALLLAREQWGNDGRFDYGAEAERVLAGILAATIGPVSRLPLLGDWIDPDGPDFNQWTPRTSDLMPDHFRVFNLATGDPVWLDILSACQDLVDQVQTDFSPAAGLLPDFLVPQQPGGPALQPAPPDFLEGPDDGRYDYNACRDPWRLGTHALVTGDARSLAQVRRLAQWIFTATGGDPLAVRAGYNLDGTIQAADADYFTTAFAAPLAVACMTDPARQEFLNGLYEAVKQSSEDYYEDTLTALCLLVLSGNWWTPFDAATASPAVPELELDLLAPYPNPFNPATVFTYSVNGTASLSLVLYDARGRLVRHLLSGPVSPGKYSITWDGRGDDGSRCPAGVYFARLTGSRNILTVKATLVD